MSLFSSVTMCKLLATICGSLIAFAFTTLHAYIGRSEMGYQIAPPNSTLPYPKDLTLRSVALGIGHQTYRCRNRGDWPELQNSHSRSSHCYLGSKIDTH